MRENEPTWLKEARAAFHNEDRKEAERITRAKLAEAEAVGDMPTVILATEHLSFLLMAQFKRQDEYEATKQRAARLKEHHARETIRLLEGSVGPDHPELLSPLISLAEVLKARLYEGRHFQPGKVRELDDLFQQVRRIHDRIEAICTAAHGPDSVEYARHLMREANFLSQTVGTPNQAIELIKQAITILKRCKGEDKDLRMAEFSLAGTLRDAGRWEDAASAYEQILAAEPDAKTNSPVKALLGMVYERLGMKDEALALQRDVEAADEVALNQKPYLAVPHVYHMAGELMRAGKLHEAESQYQKALELNAAAPDDKLMMRGLIQRDFAECLVALERAGDAVLMARESLQSIERELGPHHFHTAASLMALCECLAAARAESAIPELATRAATVLLALPDDRLMRDDGLVKECIQLLKSISLIELAQRLNARLAMLPEDWMPPSSGT